MPQYTLIPFYGLNIFSGSQETVVACVKSFISFKKRVYICVTGIHGLTQAHTDTQVCSAHKNASLIVPDGMPLVWLGKALGHPLTQRIYGPDFALALARMCEKEKYRIFLYGSTRATVKRLETKLKNLYSTIVIVGTYAPPFRSLTKDEVSHIVHIINNAKPHLVLVGLSTPKQELWMYTFRKSLHAPVLIGIGAAFDFIAGTKRQAPVWMRTLGLEWLFRLSQEPLRLSRRYLVSGGIFLSLVVKIFMRKNWSKRFHE